jgi:hypothetical protein|tara:strand:+ start:449 stop:619 length:171 start_codon:yes stop_codon:yes gene_type:complete
MKEQRLLKNKDKNIGKERKASGDKCNQKEKLDCDRCKELMKLIESKNPTLLTNRNS